MCMPCSPGGRFFRLSWISTPGPAVLITAEPALSPPPFLIPTLTALAKLDGDNAKSATGRKKTANVLVFMANSVCQTQLVVISNWGWLPGQTVKLPPHPPGAAFGCQSQAVRLSYKDGCAPGQAPSPPS